MKKIRKILCRIFGHKWHMYFAVREESWKRGEFICMRCGRTETRYDFGEPLHGWWKMYGGYGTVKNQEA